MISLLRMIAIFFLAILFPFSAYAAVVNINTADTELLDTLPGIGPSKAAAIVDYRSKNGPFVRVEDIQNVSGIGSSTYEGIKPFIAISDAQAQIETATSTPDSSISNHSSGGASETYVPPPSALFVDMRGSHTVIREVPVRMTALVTTKGGARDSLATISWSFGDGSFSTGSVVEKTYHYPGTYVVVAKAVDGSTEASEDFIVTVVSAEVSIPRISGDGITITNDSKERLDLSGWRLLSDARVFRIPDGMVILPKTSVLIPYAVTNLPIAFEAMLQYPNGTIATRSAPNILSSEIPSSMIATTSPVQPSMTMPSYKKIGTDDRSIGRDEQASVIGAKVTTHAHEDVLAPAAAKELAVAGAVLPAPSVVTEGGGTLSKLFYSPWSFGLLGVIALAGGAFILI